MKTGPHYRSLPRRFRRPTVLILGCGDVGRRLGAGLRARQPDDRIRVVGSLRNPAQAPELRALGIAPLLADLDDRRSLRRLAPFARWLVDLAPPPASGTTDPRTIRLIAAAGRRGPLGRAGRWRASASAGASRFGDPMRWVYISTTGVYGDCGGASFDETRPVAPASDRAVRRVDAERRMRRATAAGRIRASILRVPGIYDSAGRLPVERLRKGLPALVPGDDVYTNHIHAEDLARISWTALFRGRPGRVVHAVDSSDLKMGDYFDQVADALALPRPPRVTRPELAARVSPMMLSFMSESRRLGNRRLLRELRARLLYPTVAATLAEIRQGLL